LDPFVVITSLVIVGTFLGSIAAYIVVIKVDIIVSIMRVVINTKPIVKPVILAILSVYHYQRFY